MTKDKEGARERVRLRLKDLLAEHNIDQRTFGKKLGRQRPDQYAWSILSGRAPLALDDLDVAAHVARTTPGELVRGLDEEAWILSPTEMRTVRALRALPPAIRDHLVTLADYLRGVAPEEIELLQRYRQLDPEEQERLVHGLEVLWLTRLDGPGTRSISDRLQKAGGTRRPTRARETPPPK